MKQEKKYILAAGGILKRTDADGICRIAVVHRKRYFDRNGSEGDWVLPKGKCQEGERFETTALRETEEETGCNGKIIGPTYPLEYEVKGVPKVVMFFGMEYIGETKNLDTSEVSEVIWLTPEEAIERISYEKERDILRKAFFE